MPATLEAKTKLTRGHAPLSDTDPWAAHNASSHIPNAETARAIEDAHAGRNIFGVFATGEEAVRALLESVDEPFINPDDYDNETDYINAIPGMRESILAALAAPDSEFTDVPDDWIDDDV